MSVKQEIPTLNNKRRPEGGNDYGGPVKRARVSGEWEVRLLILSKSAGAIIGKGGENIKRLRSEFDCAVNVPDSASPERILWVSGAQEKVCSCIRDILNRLDESAERSGHATAGTTEDKDLKMLVHQSQAGAIIGRAGFKIKELREETKTEIKVYSECCPMSTDRVVQIVGQNEQIVNALRKINQICDETPIKGPSKPYDTINYDPSIVFDYGGFQPDIKFAPPMGGIGRGVAGFRGRPPPPGAFVGGGMRGGRGAAGFPPPFQGYADDYGRHPPRGGRVPRGGMGRMMHDDYSGFASARGMFGQPEEEPVTTTQVTIPNDLAGTIIGKGGERINRIRDDSGAKINVDQAVPGSDERIITITGTQLQINTAQYLLQQCVRSSGPGRQYIQEQERRGGY